MFMQGHLDSSMTDKVKALDPSFQFEDLRFIREEILSGVLSGDIVLPDVQMSAAQRAKVLADFDLFKLELQADALAFRKYMTELIQHEDGEAELLVANLEAQEDLIAAAVEVHRDAVYRVSSFPDWTYLPNYLSSGLASFSALPPGFVPAKVLRLNIINAAALGAQHSQVTATVAKHLAADHAGHPLVTMSIVVLPNVPAWGKKGKQRPTQAMVEEWAGSSGLKLRALQLGV